MREVYVDSIPRSKVSRGRGVRHGQKSRTPTSEIKQKSEREIRNQVANLRARPYTVADLRARPYTFADCNGNQKLLKLKSGNHLEIQKSRTPDWCVSDPSVEAESAGQLEKRPG